MLDGFMRSTARRAMTSSRETLPTSAAGKEPMIARSDRHAVSSSIHGSSRRSWRCTSRMRAVPSLRSM